MWRSSKSLQRQPSRRPVLEALEDRCLLAVGITEFDLPQPRSYPLDIAPGPDGNFWFTEGSTDAHRIGRITPDGTVTEFALPDQSGTPLAITAGPDGNLWFSLRYDDPSVNPIHSISRLGRITLDGQLTIFPPSGMDDYQLDITAGPDGNLWLVDAIKNNIVRVTLTGQATVFPVPTPLSSPAGITAGPDGNLWFTEGQTAKIGRITPDGEITEFSLPPGPGNINPIGIVTGPDGNLWYTRTTRIGRITPTGSVSEFNLPSADRDAANLTVGPDGNLWFSETAHAVLTLGLGYVGKITLDGSVTEYPIPTSNFYVNTIVTGADGHLWFVESNDKIGRVDLNAPELMPSKALAASTGSTFDGIMATFQPPRPAAQDTDFTATIHWGDGTASAGVVRDSGGTFAVSASHTFAAGGSIPVAIVLNDQASNIATAALAQVSVVSPNERFVQQLFRELLRREVDSVGLPAWTGMLDAGANRIDVVHGIQNSTEYRTNLIQRIYANVLHRSAEPGGLDAWLRFLAAGHTAEQLQAQVLASSEFFQRFGQGSDNGFLQALYHAALHRDLDGVGATAWSQALAGGAGRGVVAKAVLDSTEALQQSVQSLFQEFLNRPADSFGLDVFTKALTRGVAGADIAAILLTSPEFLGHI